MILPHLDPTANAKASDAAYNSDLSPPRRRGRVSSSPVATRKNLVPGENDLSPPRRARSFKTSDSRESEDLPPPRKSRKGVDKTSTRDSSSQWSTEVDLSPPRFNEMDGSASGRGAEPLYRIEGKHVSMEEYLKKKTRKHEKPKEEKKLEWAKAWLRNVKLKRSSRKWNLRKLSHLHDPGMIRNETK